MCLYHATLSQLNIGDVLNATNTQNTYVQAVVEIEKCKPTSSPSRSVALFATDSPEKAYLYAEKEFGASAIIEVYEVEMPINYKAPMCLVHQIHKRIQANSLYSHLVSEYWNSKMNWHFYEYFGPEIRIIAKCSKPKTSDVFREDIRYKNDFDIARNM